MKGSCLAGAGVIPSAIPHLRPTMLDTNTHRTKKTFRDVAGNLFTVVLTTASNSYLTMVLQPRARSKPPPACATKAMLFLDLDTQVKGSRMAQRSS